VRHSALREAAARGNVALGHSGLVVLSFGNLSVADRSAGVMAIKASGMDYAHLTPDDMVVLDIASGDVLEGANRPSTDAPTHLAIYRAFEGVGGVVHTHSAYATSWAQACRPIPCLGTTHADHFRGPVPVTRSLRAEEIECGYEESTGQVIVECFTRDDLSPRELPGVLVASHGPFTWGAGGDEALEHAIALEHIASIATHQAVLGELSEINHALRERHFNRKRGPDAYYGQKAPGAATVATGSRR
jgi:L-ribulose-5-phosphate 4-epimerase